MGARLFSIGERSSKYEIEEDQIKNYGIEMELDI